MLTGTRIILTIIIVNIIMLFLMLFKLPNYRIPGIITVAVLTILAGVFLVKETTNYMNTFAHIILIVGPLSFFTFINVNKNYLSILDNKHIKNNKLNVLETLAPLIMMIQMGLLYGSIGNYNSNYLYGTSIIGIINFFTVGLLWREVSFYVTDG